MSRTKKTKLREFLSPDKLSEFDWVGYPNQVAPGQGPYSGSEKQAEDRSSVGACCWQGEEVVRTEKARKKDAIVRTFSLKIFTSSTLCFLCSILLG